MVSSARRIAANRRNAKKSTGPRTLAGMRRAVLNSSRQRLFPQEFAQKLRARGEDPREFLRLFRDLMALFLPEEPVATEAVMELALTWWEKARRIREWVAAGPARVDDLDERLEQLLEVVVFTQRAQHLWWQQRLGSVFATPLQGPKELRQGIEARLFLFGAKPGRRNYPRQQSFAEKAYDFERVLEKIAQLRQQSEKAKKVSA